MFSHTPGDPDNLVQLSDRRRDDRPVPISHKIAEREEKELRLLQQLAPTDAELVEAAERTDAGLRLAVPMLFDGLGADPEPPPNTRESISPELASLVVARIDDARVKLREAMKLLDGSGDRAAHIGVAEEVERVSALTALLIEKWGVS
jgi:hypothetical protein